MDNNCFKRAQEVMQENFGHIVEMCLASCVDNKVTVRDLNTYYRDGKFYVLRRKAIRLFTI